MKPVPLSTGLGEFMAPGTLVMPLILAPDGTVTVDPGALHGRSAIEGSVRFVQKRSELTNPQVYWVIWVAVEFDASNEPVRYKGVAASELLIDPVSRTGYKALAEAVNRMSEAMRGGVNLLTLDPTAKTKIREQLMALGSQLWERSAESFKEALT